jgi:hypothetical protein
MRGLIFGTLAWAAAALAGVLFLSRIYDLAVFTATAAALFYLLTIE